MSLATWTLTFPAFFDHRRFLNSTMVMCGVAAVSKTFMTFGSYTGVHNMNPFLKILYDSKRTRPILTGTHNRSEPFSYVIMIW